ncbi:Choline-sulfatase [Planctomycetales bacterium 10988]|nr:Choline-sulfatase [Planctomycetales bacterium 10988]
MKITTTSTFLWLVVLLIPPLGNLVNAQEKAAKPNILWISSEDNGPELGCYGDKYADTPNIDALAMKGLRYNVCWSNAPVCAPARTTIIAGMYATSTGGQHMRSMVKLPEDFKMFPQYLMDAGYYCTNNSKEDYNLEKPGKVWDQSNNKAHYKNRPGDKPFFAVFNFTSSHESRIRRRPHDIVHNPDDAPVPAYHPNVPPVRQDWAQYYDVVSAMDKQVGATLKELEKERLTEDTIVFYFGDHGSGMPRSKRWPYDSGLHVPLIVYIPEKFKDLMPDDYQAGGSTDRLVSFVDFAPTVLNLAGVEIPKQIQGKAFLGKDLTKPAEYIFGYRGRMDERYDLVRSVRDERYVYIRNFMPHRIYGQYIDYMFQTPTTKIWKTLYDEGRLEAPQTFFWEEKPSEELYDLDQDPDEVVNLADSPEHQEIKERLSDALEEQLVMSGDTGFLPEAMLHARLNGRAPFELAFDTEGYPLKQILATAAIASSRKFESAFPILLQGLTDPESAVRYWSALGFVVNGEAGVKLANEPLVKALKDESPAVRVVAAEALARYGTKKDQKKALEVLVDLSDCHEHGLFVALLSLNSLDAVELDKLKANEKWLLPKIKELPDMPENVDRRLRSYIKNLLSRLTSRFEEKTE